MFGIATSTIKMYGIIALAGLVGVFLFLFKMRGMKIEGLESKISELVQQAKVNQQKAIEDRKAKKATKEFQKIADEGNSKKTKVSNEVSELVDSTIKKNPVHKDIQKEKQKNDVFLDSVRVGL